MCLSLSITITDRNDTFLSTGSFVCRSTYAYGTIIYSIQVLYTKLLTVNTKFTFSGKEKRQTFVYI